MSELEQYDYHLPRELIAQQPLPHRADARLLVADRATQTLQHAHIRDLPEILRPGDCLVLNDTRVVPARLVGYRTRTGGRWQGLFLDCDAAGNWRLLCKTRGKLTPTETVTLQDRSSQDRFPLRLLADLGEGLWAARPEAEGSAWELLEQVGRVPLPPYIRGGEMVESDRDHYQTVFADKAGAVAAPTAGLHFTRELLDQLRAAGIAICRITLHLGAGTFRPISAVRLAEHAMHTEWGQLDADTAQQLQTARGGRQRIVAVGTSVVRVLETVAASGQLQPWQGETNLFIRPPYDFQAVDALLTNFHLPKTTLLVLIRTLGGDQFMRRAYQVAIAERYRFYSYGDAMLIL